MIQKTATALSPHGKKASFWSLGLLVIVLAWCPLTASAQQSPLDTGVISSLSTTGFATSAYPVIARIASGRLVCVFAAIDQTGPKKMRIVVTHSDDDGHSWSKPAVLFDHPEKDDADPNLLVDGDRILAFSTTVKKPNKIDSTDIYMRTSADGVQWSEERHIDKPHRYICGKIHQGHRLKDGTLVMGYSWDIWAEQHMPAATEGQMDLKSGVLRSTDGGKTWHPGADMHADVKRISPYSTGGLAEPATVVLADGRIMCLMRAAGDKFYQSWSSDGGLTWETPRPSTLTAHNTPAALWKMDGSGDIVVVWDNSPVARDPLTTALSKDGGKTWSTPRVLATTGGPQVSYPSVVQAKDGTIIAVWQQNVDKGREIRIGRYNRAWLLGRGQ